MNKKELKKTNSGLSLEQFYDLKVIEPSNITKYILHNSILNKIIKDVIPILKSNKINCYIVPLPLSNTGKYLSDYADSYVSTFHNKNYIDLSYIIIIIKLHNNLEINLNQYVIIDFQLNIKEQRVVYNTFIKKLPHNYKWNRMDTEVMEINYNLMY